MRIILAISLFTIIAAAALKSYAVPAPCTNEELMESSDFAIEGTVTEIKCEAPYDSEECSPNAEHKDKFTPELISKCVATVKVTKSIKGKYMPGDEAHIPYLQLVQRCENGTHIIPGSPVKIFVPNSTVKFYDSERCKYWNYTQISVPPEGGTNNEAN